MTLGGVSLAGSAMPWFKHLLPQTSFIPIQELSFVYRSLLALAAVVTALAINWLVAPHVSLLPPFLTFVAAVINGVARRICISDIGDGSFRARHQLLFIPPVYQGNGKGGPSLARGTLQP